MSSDVELAISDDGINDIVVGGKPGGQPYTPKEPDTAPRTAKPRDDEYSVENYDVWDWS